MRLSAHLEMLLVVVIWGGNFTASKVAFPTIPPLAFTAVRFVSGSLLLWFALGRLEGSRRPPRELLPRLFLLGFVGNTLYQLCFITGLARTTATNTSLILSAMPTVVTVTAGLLGLERITGRQRWALAVATLGVLVVVASRGLALGHGDWRGDLLILAAVLCWTGYTIGLRYLGEGVSSLSATTWTMILGTPGLLLAGLPQLSRMTWPAVTWPAWTGLAYSTALSLLAAYLLWTRAVQRIGASRAALYTCLTPLVATTIAMAILRERPTWVHLVGGGMIVVGVLLGRGQLDRGEGGKRGSGEDGKRGEGRYRIPE
jgi:drug/metabolite transporter (DMT)-like permease